MAERVKALFLQRLPTMCVICDQLLPLSVGHLRLRTCLFVPCLSSCHETATVALYFGWIHTCL